MGYTKNQNRCPNRSDTRQCTNDHTTMNKYGGAHSNNASMCVDVMVCVSVGK